MIDKLFMKSITDIKKRVLESDLVPSRLSLLESIDENINQLELCGYGNPEYLREELKSKKRLESVSKKTGISIDYLKLFKRELEGYFPKKIKLTEFIYADEGTVEKCISDGLKDSLLFYERYKSEKIEDEDLKKLFYQVQLTRIQWVSPMAAEMFIFAGYLTPKDIEVADPEKFCEDVKEVNSRLQFFKGNIGLRDMKRVVHSAKYVD